MFQQRCGSGEKALETEKWGNSKNMNSEAEMQDLLHSMAKVEVGKENKWKKEHGVKISISEQHLANNAQRPTQAETQSA